ncbi:MULTISPECIES: thioredoxin family protein [Nonlabens]|uniref:Thioredoxin-like protein n=1 Tax=Nonlabens xylanidelens TaxID=191564 RepID=A0A2S6IF04_9FLAO|nr:thioredoxin family protein [Nonlabens xylanidelens]PPK92805.1 thioredoxin-like protein [Nonlabens xylanidelens]
MRLLFILPFLLFSMAVSAQDEASNDVQVANSEEVTYDLQWLTSLDEAKKEARKTKKPILVYFTGSDWCTPCVKLEKYFFHTDKFVEESAKYHIVYLDNPYRDDIISENEKKTNKKLSDKYKVKYPTIIALDYRGSERNRVERFSGNDPRYHWRFMDENKSIFRL